MAVSNEDAMAVLGDDSMSNPIQEFLREEEAAAIRTVVQHEGPVVVDWQERKEEDMMKSALVRIAVAAEALVTSEQRSKELETKVQEYLQGIEVNIRRLLAEHMAEWKQFLYGELAKLSQPTEDRQLDNWMNDIHANQKRLIEQNETAAQAYREWSQVAQNLSQRVEKLEERNW